MLFLKGSLGSSAIPLNGNPKLKKFVEDTIIEVRKFIQENKEDELVLDGCNSYLRFVIVLCFYSIIIENLL